MSFNDLVKKEAARKKASQEKGPKSESVDDKSSTPESKSVDPCGTEEPDPARSHRATNS